MEAYGHLPVIDRQQAYGQKNTQLRRAFFAVTGVLALASSSFASTEYSIQWGECPPVQEGFPEIGVQQCALVRVPLDYRRPTGALIDIAVSRISAADPAKRRGALLLNIGGPGGRGLDMPRLALALYPQELIEAYDLIGFDPRGVGRSAPVSCGLTAERSLRAVPTLAEDGGFEATANFASDVAAACAGAAGSILPFMTTANTARDIERIRIALGEERISYLGYSYGTYLGAVYASMFPRRVERWVLDSAVNPDWVWRAQFRQWGRAGEERFADFIDYAIANAQTLNFGDTPEEIRALFLELAGDAERSPIEFDGFVVDGPMFRVLTFSFLYNDALLPEIPRLWQAVLNASAQESVATSAGIASIATFPEVPPDNSEMSAGAVLCDDARWSHAVDRYRGELIADTRAYPLFAELGSNIWPCAFWPNDPVEPLVGISSRGAPNNILILNTFRDPATPLPGASRMRALLGERAKLVLVEGGGHGIFGLGDNLCATQTVTSFLVDGLMPSADTTCPANAAQMRLDTDASPSRLRLIKAAVREMIGALR